ncbi:MAG: hypothetical protein K2K02_00290, partial [Ruminococcus sp.]|nr:hypothetical protein [Ruminococcus sp.]
MQNDKKNIPESDDGKKIEVKKSIFQSAKELREQQEIEMRKQAELRQRKKQEEYDKRIREERI